jgi:hypothetical protein
LRAQPVWRRRDRCLLGVDPPVGARCTLKSHRPRGAEIVESYARRRPCTSSSELTAHG